MKDNGKTEAVKNCTISRNWDNSDLCIHCRNGNPHADASAYDLLWENDARGFTPGDVVMWSGNECTVLSVCESDGVKMLELLKIDVDEGNSGEFMISRNLVPAAHCAKQVKELTAKEYAEKLREYFGKPVSGELDIKDCFCSERNCKGCAFDSDPHCVAAVVMFDPERALQMIQEAKNKDKPKGKTYLEDFREKFPNCVLCSDGTPTCCRCEAYGGTCEESDYPEGEACVRCWNEVMPEEGK